jgi:hypothetical protein
MLSKLLWGFIGMAIVRFWDWMSGVPQEWDPGAEFCLYLVVIAAVLLLQEFLHWHAQRSRAAASPQINEETP